MSICSPKRPSRRALCHARRDLSGVQTLVAGCRHAPSREAFSADFAGYCFTTVSPACKLCQNDIPRSRTVVLPRSVVFGAVRTLCNQTRYDVPTLCPCHSRKLGACSPVLRLPICFSPRVGAVLLSSHRWHHLWTYSPATMRSRFLRFLGVQLSGAH